MAFWSRRPPVERHSASVTAVSLGAVTAAAQEFDLDNAEDRRRLAKLQQQWQTDAWLYLDRIGELKDAYRFVENSFRRLSVHAAFQRSPDDEPIPVADAVEAPDGMEDVETEDLLPQDVADLAESIMRDFAARDGGQSSLLARLGANIFMVGEALIIQRAVPARRPGPNEKAEEVERVWDWEVRSLHEIRADESGRAIETVDSPDQQRGTPIEGKDGDPPYVERIYRRAGCYSGWADSNVKAAMDTLEEMRLLSLVARASLRSRAMAGFFRLPEELDFAATDTPGGAPGPMTSGVTFERSMADAFAAAIGNEADPNSVAPLLVRGKAEFLHTDVFGPVEMPRRYAADERAQYEDAVRKLARTIELPMEAVIGAENLNHWNVFSIDDQKYRAYIEPLALVGAEGLTYGLLRPRLRAEGVEERWVDRIVVDVNATGLIRRSDVGKVAEGLHGLGAVSDDSLRRHNGFGDGDAPSDEELLRRWLLRSNVSPDLIPQLLKLAELTDEQVVAPLALAPGSGTDDEDDDEPHAPEPSHGPPPEDDREPAGPPAAMTAALAAERDVGRALASIDAVLLERLLTAADQAVSRVLERVGARVRSRPKSSQPAALRDALSAAKSVPNSALVRHLDSALVAAAVGPEPVTVEDFADMEARFEAWVLAAQDASVRELSSLAGGDATDDLLARTREEQAADRSEGWQALLAALVAYTLSLAARTDDAFDESGEWDPTITVRPSVVREALAVAGGNLVEHVGMGGVAAPNAGPLGGVATGQTVQRAFAQAGYVFGEWIWEYGSAPRQRPFEPHLGLDGVLSSEWGSYAPGDHGNCRCGMVPRLVPTASVAAA